MPSEFDTFAAEFASPAMVEHFGERNDHGELATITYKPPVGEEVELVGVIVTSQRVTDEIETALGTHSRDELEQECLLVIPREQDGKRFTPQDGSQFFVDDHFGGDRPDEPFAQKTVDDLTEVFASVRVVRTLVSRLQRGSVERD